MNLYLEETVDQRINEICVYSWTSYDAGKAPICDSCPLKLQCLSYNETDGSEYEKAKALAKALNSKIYEIYESREADKK